MGQARRYCKGEGEREEYRRRTVPILRADNSLILVNVMTTNDDQRVRLNKVISLTNHKSVRHFGGFCLTCSGRKNYLIRKRGYIIAFGPTFLLSFLSSLVAFTDVCTLCLANCRHRSAEVPRYPFLGYC
jgi:hypothetical protein